MKAATQSCSEKKVHSKFRQNPQKYPQRSPFSSKATGLKPATLPKKSPPPQAYPSPKLFYYVLEFQEHLLMAASVVNIVGNLPFH